MTEAAGSSSCLLPHPYSGGGGGGLDHLDSEYCNSDQARPSPWSSDRCGGSKVEGLTLLCLFSRSHQDWWDEETLMVLDWIETHARCLINTNCGFWRHKVGKKEDSKNEITQAQLRSLSPEHTLLGPAAVFEQDVNHIHHSWLLELQVHSGFTQPVKFPASVFTPSAVFNQEHEWARVVPVHRSVHFRHFLFTASEEDLSLIAFLRHCRISVIFQCICFR